MPRYRLIILLLLANVAGLALWLALPIRAHKTVVKSSSSALAGLSPETRIRFPGEVPNLEEQAPFTGPTPTRDMQTWRLIDPGYVLGALIEVDSRDGRTLSPRQARELVAWTKLMGTNQAETNDAEVLFSEIVPDVLTPAQKRAVVADRASLEREPVDLSALALRTRNLASRAPVKEPPPFHAVPLPAPTTVGLYLAALEMLEKPGPDSLTSAQAVRLAAPLERLNRATDARVVNYGRVTALLTDAQADELTQVLTDVHSGRLDASTVYQPPREVETWLQKRAGP